MKMYHWNKLPLLHQFLGVAMMCLITMIILTPLFPSFFDTPEAAQSGVRWIISIFGIVAGLITFSTFRDQVLQFASDGKVRVLFTDHSALTESVEGEYADLASAEYEISRNYEVSKIFGMFLFYDDKGGLLKKLIP